MALSDLLRSPGYVPVSAQLDGGAVEMPIKQDAEREHYLEGFRHAGLC
jgi:hypothetical protein